MNIWNFHARIYEKLWVQKLSLKPTRTTVLSYLQETMADRIEPFTVLDIGCGTGQLLREIKGLFGARCQCIGIDAAEEMIRIARTSSNGITYDVMDAASLCASKERYDVIICTHSLPYYKDQRGFLRSMSTKLVLGGFAVIASASCSSIYDHIILFFVKLTTGRAHYPGIKEFSALTQNFLNIEQTMIIPTQFFVPSLIMHVLKRIDE